LELGVTFLHCPAFDSLGFKTSGFDSDFARPSPVSAVLDSDALDRKTCRATSAKLEILSVDALSPDPKDAGRASESAILPNEIRLGELD